MMQKTHEATAVLSGPVEWSAALLEHVYKIHRSIISITLVYLQSDIGESVSSVSWGELGSLIHADRCRRLRPTIRLSIRRGCLVLPIAVFVDEP